MMNNILIAGAHFDDAELGAGGTAARLASEGKSVYKLTLTDNVTHSEHLNVNVEYERSAAESAKAAKVLGIKEITDFDPLPCSNLVYDTMIMRRIEDIIYDLKIDTVFLHFHDDMNQDHIEAHKLCITAARHCRNIFMYRSNLYTTTHAFNPTFFVDISGQIDLKRQALKQYTGDHNRNNALFETVIERNHVWGYSNGTGYAEGFEVHHCLYGGT